MIFKTGVVYLYTGCLSKSGRDHIIFLSGLERVQKTPRNRIVHKYKLQGRNLPKQHLSDCFHYLQKKNHAILHERGILN